MKINQLSPFYVTEKLLLLLLEQKEFILWQEDKSEENFKNYYKHHIKFYKNIRVIYQSVYKVKDSNKITDRNLYTWFSGEVDFIIDGLKLAYKSRNEKQTTEDNTYLNDSQVSIMELEVSRDGSKNKVVEAYDFSQRIVTLNPNGYEFALRLYEQKTQDVRFLQQDKLSKFTIIVSIFDLIISMVVMFQNNSSEKKLIDRLNNELLDKKIEIEFLKLKMIE